MEKELKKLILYYERTYTSTDAFNVEYGHNKKETYYEGRADAQREIVAELKKILNNF